MAVPLYARLAPDALLDHPVRVAVYEALRREPGLTQEDLARIAGVGRSTVRHHVLSLARAGPIQVVPVGREVLHFHLVRLVEAGLAVRLEGPVRHGAAPRA